MTKKEYQRLTSRTSRAAQKIQKSIDVIQQRMNRAKQERFIRRMRRAEGAAVEIPSRGIRLMGCVDLPTIKEAIVQNNRFKANSEHKIQYLLMQDVELHQLGNVLIVQPKGAADPGDRHVPVSQIPVSQIPVSQIEVSQPKTPRRYMSLPRRVKLLKEILKGLAGRKCANMITQNAANCLCLPCRARAVKERHLTVTQRANLIREIRSVLADCECSNFGQGSKDCHCLSCKARAAKG